jgi:ribosome recycling factor
MALAQLRVDRRRRRLLDDLLVTALDRALALEQVHQVAVTSPRIWISTWRDRQPALDQHRAVA